MGFNLITILSVLILLTSPIRFWYYSKGHLYVSYRIELFVFTCYLVLETHLALLTPEQHSLMLMNIINIWALAMAVKGIFRLKKEDKDKLNNQQYLNCEGLLVVYESCS
jgi:hypothetical protein